MQTIWLNGIGNLHRLSFVIFITDQHHKAVGHHNKLAAEDSQPICDQLQSVLHTEALKPDNLRVWSL